ncbi:MAG TPA: hypothetical protein VMW83_16835 [Spirochaetia bacterium]|nr:hypothetical protein [Spirochaetia bacterium]
MAFEVYVPRRGGGRGAGRVKKTPALRLSKSSLVLNKLAREALGAQSIELAYDADTKTIRVSPNGSIPMKKTKVFAKGFFKSFGINSNGSFPAELKDGCLFAQIS